MIKIKKILKMELKWNNKNGMKVKNGIIKN
jgi:hypothetical protein